MLKILLARLKQGHRTIKYPAGPAPELPDRFRGRPVLDSSRCPEDCHACADACPTGAMVFEGKSARVDLGKCLFCPDCAAACPIQAITYQSDYRLSVRRREDLVLEQDQPVIKRAAALDEKMKRLAEEQAEKGN